MRLSSKSHLLAALCAMACSSGGSTGPQAQGSVQIQADRTSLLPGETVQLTWQVKDAQGAVVTGQTPSFLSSSATTASVTGGGLVTAILAGNVTITATAGQATGTLNLTIGQGGLVTAAGGTVSGFGGAIELVIPAGAVTAPISIRLTTAGNPLLDPTAVAGSIYLISPEDLTFALPVTARVRYNPSARPEGLPEAALRVRRYTGTAWVGLPDGSANVPASQAIGSLSGGGFVSVGWAVPDAPCTGPEYRQFDFWLGAWNVSVAGQIIGQSDITAVPGGCAVLEHFRPNGAPVGRSINFYDPTTGKWYQTYLDSSGKRLPIAGSFVNGAMDLINPPGGGTLQERWRWTVEGDNVRQAAATSTNGGQTYSAPTWNGLYIRR
ncbi:MAG: hypothetical protein HOP28_14605 [Gemmatimonadales bacterium]|nr:hypothetical protein [Gemmatimonadales bacterium]